jgi:hypothetical protein
MRTGTAPDLVVLSRDRAESYDPQGVEVCISITDPGAPHVTLSPRFAAVLRLEFSDILAADRPGQKPFGPEADRRFAQRRL